MAKNATNWFNKINAVLDTIGDFSPVNDRKTYNVIKRAIPDLMSVRGVDHSMKDTLLRNIAIRVGPRDIQHNGPLILTKNQRSYARKMGWDQLPSFDDLYAVGSARAAIQPSANGDEAGYENIDVRDESGMKDPELLEAIHTYFTLVSSHFHTSFIPVSSQMPQRLAEKLEFWMLNELNGNEMNHGEPMIPASQVHEEVVLPPFIQEVIQSGKAIELSNSPFTQSELKGHEQEGEIARPPYSAPARRQADALTIWVKEDKRGKLRASGYLDADGEKFALSFSTYYSGLERIVKTAENSKFFDRMCGNIADLAIEQERNSTGIAAKATLSAVYAVNDRFATKEPVLDSLAVLLEWQGERPVAAYLVGGEKPITVTMKQESGDRFKGALKLAA